VLGCCSVELRLRFPGTDLWSGHKALQSEVSLMFLLLGAVYVHHLPQLLTQLGFDPLLLDTNTPVHIVATVAVLTLPGAAAAATDGLMRLVAGELLLMVASGVALCCDTLCCTMLCCAVLCRAVLHYLHSMDAPVSLQVPHSSSLWQLLCQVQTPSALPARSRSEG